ncbi:MAG: HlyD family efflux transporter periplasmic adaptor subunit [Planctomycetaceae bacterium]|jgi:biotin carboxyl carrier protein|nr:HlyD family efflux transporter periplasmic adaptor subunit [Planctomycetaceae bacterium]
MYNSLTLIALVPLIGPGAVDQSGSNYQPTNIQYAKLADNIDALPNPNPVFNSSLPQPQKPETPDNIVAVNQTNPPNNFPVANQPLPSQPSNTSSVVNGELAIDGWLEVPKRNHIVLAAPCSAVLMSLKTTQDKKEMNITEGMFVKKDQALGKFDDRTLQNQLSIDEAQLNVAIAAENKIIEVEYAARSLQVAITKVNMMKEINKRHSGTVPAMEVLLAEQEQMQAAANLDLCKYAIAHERKEETNVRKQTIEATKTNIKIRQLVSPIDGIITKVERAEGEYIREGEPVLEITQLDTLRAVLKVNAAHCSPNQIDGKNVAVQLKNFNENQETFTGKIIFIDPKVSMSSNDYDVFIEIKNQKIGNTWKLQPGSRVSAKIKL